MRDGRTYQFAGFLDSVRTSNGETVQVDNEGTVRDQNQTKTTEERAAIGTAVGAIIGAIAGGGKGAAIGAILGAGAGAGSVYAQGRDDLGITTSQIASGSFVEPDGSMRVCPSANFMLKNGNDGRHSDR